MESELRYKLRLFWHKLGLRWIPWLILALILKLFIRDEEEPNDKALEKMGEAFW